MGHLAAQAESPLRQEDRHLQCWEGLQDKSCKLWTLNCKEREESHSPECGFLQDCKQSFKCWESVSVSIFKLALPSFVSKAVFHLLRSWGRGHVAVGEELRQNYQLANTPASSKQLFRSAKCLTQGSLNVTV